MKVTFWGVRGSISSPAPHLLRYGAQTPCVQVTARSGHTVALDVGTGFIGMGGALMGGPLGRGQGELTILLSHAHWDHIIGFPFPGPVHIPGNRFAVYGGASSREALWSVHQRVVAPAFSPKYSMDKMGSQFELHVLDREPFQIGSLTVTARPLPHSNVEIWSFRLEEEGRALVYMTDVQHTRDYVDPQAVAFAQGADAVIHDAHFTDGDYRPWGHSTLEGAIALAAQARARRLFWFHHHPDRADDEIDAQLQQWRHRLAAGGSSLQLDAAAEGLSFEV